MSIKNLSLANAELVDQLRIDIIKCCQDYCRKRGRGCHNCPYKEICDAHDELFWAIDERDNKDNSAD